MSSHSSGTESQQLRMTVSPSHSSLAAKKALGVNLPPQVLSVISVAAHGTGQRQQQEGKSKRKIQRLLMEWQQEELVFIKGSESLCSQGCGMLCLSPANRPLASDPGWRRAERSVAASPANILLVRKSATRVSRQVRAGYTCHCASVT